MRERIAQCASLWNAHKYVNDTVFPSMEKYAYLNSISSKVGKCFNESMKDSNSNLKETSP